MSDEDVSAAVAAAISCDWARAKALNQKLLTQNPHDVDCLNRLGKALLELDEKPRAITIFRRILKIDRYNSIAQKNLDRAVASRHGDETKPGKAKSASPAKIANQPLVTNFLEEPGKTKLISLINLAPANTILKLSYGDAVSLAPKRHTVMVQDRDSNYIGAIPDDLGHRLSVLVAAGNRYDGLIKSISKNAVVVLVREISRAKKFRNTPSFPTASNDYFSFVREETINHEGKPADTSAEEDEEEAESPGAHLHQDEEEAE